jgi:dienelactone hydrolase
MIAASGIPPERSAAIGYCFGGFAVLELARSGARLAAVASFHGLLTTARAAEPGGITTRILACTGDADPLVPPEDVAAFQAEMRAADADWQLLVHGGALHSYTNVDVDGLGDPRMAYDARADELSWAALLTHLGASLE